MRPTIRLLLAAAVLVAGCATQVRQSQRNPEYDRQPARLSVRWSPALPQSLHITKTAQGYQPVISETDRASAREVARKHFVDMRSRSKALFSDSLQRHGVELTAPELAEAELLITPAPEVEAVCTALPCSVWLTADVTLYDRQVATQAWTGKVRALSSRTSTSYDQMTRQTTQKRSDPPREFVEAVVGELEKARIVKPAS